MMSLKSLRSKERKKDIASRVSIETKGFSAYGFVVPWDNGILPPAAVITVLESFSLSCFLVFHDLDTDPYGNRKPPHYHVMVLFDELREALPVLWACKTLGGVSLQEVYSPRAHARYLCHLDNPDKHRYRPEEVMNINGCVYEEFIK